MDTTSHSVPFALSSEPPKQKRGQPVQREKKLPKEFEKRCQAASYDTPTATPEETSFRHEHWKKKRAAVAQAIRDTACNPHTIEQFLNCGSDCVVEYSQEEKRYRVVGNCCHNRHCEPCMRAKANLLAMNLQKKVTDSPGKQFRFITLTLRHTDTPLADQIDRLNESFKKLRSTRIWKESQDGGAAIFECKYDRETGMWHPHLHIVAEGYFLDHKNLSDEWYKITKDSFRVDIRAIKSARDAAYYVAKYTSKGTNDDVWADRAVAAEWVRTMRGRRTCATYGTWRGHRLLAKPEKSTGWTKIGTITSIMQAAARGEIWAIRCVDTLRAECQYNPHRQRAKKGTTPPVVVT